MMPCARDVLTGHPAVPPAMLDQLAALRAARADYDVIITSHSGQFRFEATRRRGETGPWCLISADPDDLWRELPAALGSNGPPGRSLHTEP
jgi:hypothetical protein